MLIVGDSNIAAFGVPIKSQDGSNQLIELKAHGNDVFGLVGAWPRQVESYWQAAREHGADAVVAVFLGGNIHLAHFLFAPSPLFDLVASENPNLPINPNADLVPEEALRKLFAPTVRELKLQILAVKAVAAQVLIVGSPPPKEDDDFIGRQLFREPHFERIAAGLGLQVAEMQLSPALLRLKLWMTLQGLMRDLSDEIGSTFIPVPSRLQSDDGFLLPSCYANDVTHANTAFGSAMMSELRAATTV